MTGGIGGLAVASGRSTAGTRPLATRVVAAPVLELVAAKAPRRGKVLGLGSRAAFLETEGFVVALTARGVPLMPNGVALLDHAEPLALLRPGSPTWIFPWGILTHSAVVCWDPVAPPVWRPEAQVRLRLAGSTAARASALLRTLGVEPRPDPAALARQVVAVDPAWASSPEAAVGIVALFRAVATGRIDLAQQAARALVGFGSGATPSADDLLAGVAVAVYAASRSRVRADDRSSGWLASLRLPDLRARTTALSATLLELALGGRVMEPAATLIRALGAADSGRIDPALAQLRGVGHSTGDRYALGIASAAMLLATTPDVARTG